MVKRQQKVGDVRSRIDECLIHPGARAKLKRLNEHRPAFGLISAPEQSVGQLNRQLQCPVVVSLAAARRLKLPENRRSSTRVSGGDQHLCLESALYRLRQLLGARDALRMVGGKVSLNRNQLWVDMWEFEEELQRRHAPGL